MGPFHPANPQQTDQNDHVAQRVAQIVLDNDDCKRQQRHQTERHNITPEQKLTFVFADQQRSERKNQDQLEQFRRLEA
ncbi:hypothetical protein D3C81_2099350 [compost metagenome]